MYIINNMKYTALTLVINDNMCFKVKEIGVLHPIQQPESYWDRPAAMSLVGVEPTQR